MCRNYPVNAGIVTCKSCDYDKVFLKILTSAGNILSLSKKAKLKVFTDFAPSFKYK